MTVTSKQEKRGTRNSQRKWLKIKVGSFFMMSAPNALLTTCMSAVDAVDSVALQCRTKCPVENVHVSRGQRLQLLLGSSIGEEDTDRQVRSQGA